MTVDAAHMDALSEERRVTVKGSQPIDLRFRVTDSVEVTPDGTYEFEHGLKKTPHIVQIQFSPDRSFDDVHIVEWPWEADQSRGPVSIRADLMSVYLEFSGAHVFGNWSYGRGWTHHPRGYFRVIAG